MLQTGMPAEMRIRPLGPGDLADVERHLLSLDIRDRNARFGGAVSDEGISRYVRRTDFSRTVLVGAIEPGDGRIIGLGEAQPTDRPGVMELAVTVDRAYRRRELGQHLLKQLLTLAFIHGAEIAEFIFDPGNGAIAGLIRTLGVRVDPTLDRAEILRSAFRDVA